MQRLKKWFAVLPLISVRLCLAQTVAVHPDHADGLYKLDDTVTWHVDLKDDPSITSLLYTIQEDQTKTVDQGQIALLDGHGTVTGHFTHPGTLFLKIKFKNANPRSLQPNGGAAAALDQIKPSAPPPGDFDAFWADQVKLLKQVPINPVLVEADSGKPTVQYSKVTLDNVDNTHVQGQIARPTTGNKFPALLIVQWAGVYALQRQAVTGRADAGWLAMNIEAHDLPIDQPADFYKTQSNGPLKDYWSIGNDDKSTSYFRRMYLSCYRAAEYLTTRPDWDGKTLVVMGTSQGGQQSLMTAGLFPGITAAIAEVPAGCDMTGPAIQRRGGWPQWWDETKGKDPAKVREASRYFDVVNFAAHIKCPTLVAEGLADETCPIDGVAAAFNQIQAPKQFIILPLGPHQDVEHSHEAYNKIANGVWLPALVKGQAPPIER